MSSFELKCFGIIVNGCSHVLTVKVFSAVPSVGSRECVTCQMTIFILKSFCVSAPVLI